MNENQDAVPMELEIGKLQLSEISNSELEGVSQSFIAKYVTVKNSIHDTVEEAAYVCKKYLDPKYVPDEKTAKADRAELNKADKSIAEMYADLKKVYEKPLQLIESDVKAIRSAIKEASEVPDKAVKLYKEIQDTKKRQDITDYFLSKKFDLIPLERIWNPKWLNKTMEMRDIIKEIDEVIAKIY